MILQWWIRNIQNIFELYGQGNFIQKTFKIIEGEISENDYKLKHAFFEKRASDCYLVRAFHDYIDNNSNKSFFSELKQLYVK